jgi:hypothetical protein
VGTVEEDFEWQQKFRGHFSEIAQHSMRVEVAPAEEDWKRNTDFVLSTVVPVRDRQIRVSARVRRHKYIRRYRDEFTVRLDRPSGVETEMPKIRAGWGDFTIYGFESEPGSDRLGPWFIGNLGLLRDYLRRGGYYIPQTNRDGSSTFGAFHLGDMPLEFVLQSEGLTAWDESRIWDQCRRCWWWRGTGGLVMPTDEDRNASGGFGRLCLACGFWWRAGWHMPMTPDERLQQANRDGIDDSWYEEELP